MLLLLAAAPAALAQDYSPSMAEMITSPVRSALLIYPLPVSLLLWAAVAGIETMIFRRLVTTSRRRRRFVVGFRVLFVVLFVLNAGTSLTGGFILRWGTVQGASIHPSWIGFLPAYVFSVAIEFPVLRFFASLRSLRFQGALRGCLLGNAASFAFLGVLLAMSTYSVYSFGESAFLRGDLEGSVLVKSYDGPIWRLSPLDGSKAEKLENTGVTGWLHGGLDGAVYVNDITNRAARRYDDLHARRIRGREARSERPVVGITRDGEMALLAEGTTLFLSPLGAGGRRTEMQTEEDVICADVSPDGRFVVTVEMHGGVETFHRSGKVRLYDRKTGEKLHEFGRGYSAAFAPDGERIGITGQTEIRIVSPAGEEMKVVTTPRRVVGNAVWSPDGESLAYLTCPPGRTRKQGVIVVQFLKPTGEVRATHPAGFYEGHERVDTSRLIWREPQEETD